MPWLIIALSYFLGSFPTAYIAGHLLRGEDIRQMGDGNMGAANAFRELGAKAGVTVAVVDASKGILSMVTAQATGIPQIAVLIAGIAAVVGHNWPIFLGFKGGRGVSTTIGVLLTIITQPMLIVSALAALTLLWKRNVTLACAILFILLPLACWWLRVSGVLVAYSVALPGLVGFTHFLRTRGHRYAEVDGR